MNTKILLLLTCFLSISTFGQAKKFTLEESVMQQNRQFKADKLSGFKWIPNSDNYTYLADSGKKLLLSKATNTSANELITLADLNKALNSNLKNFMSLFFGFLKYAKIKLNSQ